ncbi:hypothetical protein BDN67DRAFT_882647, partial [Paxillus ammoniavirescens]
VDSTGLLVKDDWPAQLIANLDYIVDKELESWQIIPDVYKDVYCTHAYMVIYKNPFNQSSDTLLPVTVRIQGFLGTNDLSVTSNGAVSAIQHLTLHPRGYPGIWEASLLAIRNVCKPVHASVGGEEVDGPLNPEQPIYMQRRVFTKVTSSTANRPSALMPCDDPTKQADICEPAWHVMEKLQIGR